MNMILKSPFTINKSVEIVQCSLVRTDSNEREKRGHTMAKTAMKMKTKAKAKKKPMKRTVAKKRATKRR
jgi:hypothetical protein